MILNIPELYFERTIRSIEAIQDLVEWRLKNKSKKNQCGSLLAHWAGLERFHELSQGGHTYIYICIVQYVLCIYIHIIRSSCALDLIRVGSSGVLRSTYK